MSNEDNRPGDPQESPGEIKIEITESIDPQQVIELLSGAVAKRRRRNRLCKKWKAETDGMTLEQKYQRLKEAFCYLEGINHLFAATLSMAHKKEFRSYLDELTENASEEHRTMIENFFTAVSAGSRHLSFVDTLGGDKVVDWARWLTIDERCCCPGCIADRAITLRNDQETTKTETE